MEKEFPQALNELIEIEKQIFSELNKLGTTLIEIRDNLEKRNITGQLGNSCNCPISNYLNQTCDGSYPNINKDYQGPFMVTSDYICKNGIKFDTPINIAQFIYNFDSGIFPELIKKDI